VAAMHSAAAARASDVAIPRAGIVLIGGMGGSMTGGGMTGGGMNGGMTGGGMNGGMTGGMTGGVTGGMGGGTAGAGFGGIAGDQPGYNAAPVGRLGQSYGGDPTTNGSPQTTQNYQCATQQGHCSVEASPGSLRHGASCGCLSGGPGKIK
jgi:hypothetical protein